MENPEKLASTNNVNKTSAHLQPTGGKEEPNSVFYAEIVTDITSRNSKHKDTKQGDTENYRNEQKLKGEPRCKRKVSYKTSAVLLIDTVKFGRNLGSDSGKKTST